MNPIIQRRSHDCTVSAATKSVNQHDFKRAAERVENRCRQTDGWTDGVGGKISAGALFSCDRLGVSTLNKPSGYPAEDII